MTAEPKNYQNAIDLMTALRKHNIDCNITTGGVSIYPQNDEEIEIVKTICKNRDIYCSMSPTTTFEEMQMFKFQQNDNNT